jgi:hypothetical protein
MIPCLLKPCPSVLHWHTTELPSHTLRVIINEPHDHITLHVRRKHRFFVQQLASSASAVDQDWLLVRGDISGTLLYAQRIEQSEAET